MTTPGVAGDHDSMERLGKLLDPSQPFAKAVDDTLDRVKDVLTYGTCDPNANRFNVLGKRGVAALWWPVDKAEVKELLVDLERYKSRIALALQHDMFKQQNVMNRQLDNMDHHTSNEDRLKMAEFISKHDYTGHRKELLEKRLSGTGTWMIRHLDFVAWRDNRESPRMLWCYGHPGAGKSVMAALIIEHLQSTPGNIVLSVFCRYSSNIFTNPSAVLSGLLRQLIEKTTKIPRAICDLYWSKTDPSPDTLPGFLAEVAASHERPIYIVIDALDECPFSSDLLRALQHLDPSFRVLLTSRPVFEEIKEHPSINIRASDKDILIAVDTTLLKLRHHWLDDELKRTIRVEVVEKADGMFLLAALQLRELERDVTCRDDVLHILASLPRTLDDAYKLTFQRIREQGDRKNELVCRALALLVFPPFTNEILQHLLAEGAMTRYPEIDTIVQCCHGLVQQDWSGYPLFIHYSVHEYTTTHWSELFPEHPSRIDLCVKLGFSTLRSIPPNQRNWWSWRALLSRLANPEELSQVVPFLSIHEDAVLYGDVADPQTFLIEQRLFLTGSWMTMCPEFVAWRDDRESATTLWCYGPPGAGKSIMAASIVDHLQSRGDIALSLFCGYLSDTFNFPAPSHILKYLLQQLIENFPKVLPIVCALYESQNPKPDTLPVFLAQRAASYERPIYIIIDALDRCPIALDVLRAIQQLGPAFRILVTSRPVFTKEIEEQPVSIEMRASDEDILAAVDTTLLGLRHWLDDDSEDTIRTAVVDRADGVFLLASLHLRALERNVPGGGDGMLSDVLASLPRTLDDAYKVAFHGEGKKRDLACGALALTAQGFLGDVPRLLMHRDMPKSASVDAIVRCCHGLVRPAYFGASAFAFIHYTVHEYATAHWAELFPEHPDRVDFCLELALTDSDSWHSVVRAMRRPEELDKVVARLSSQARAALLEANAASEPAPLAPFVDDPLLIACYFAYERVVEYIIQSAPLNVERFNEALRAARVGPSDSGCTVKFISARVDVRVNNDGVVVPVGELGN